MNKEPVDVAILANAPFKLDKDALFWVEETFQAVIWKGHV